VTVLFHVAPQLSTSDVRDHSQRKREPRSYLAKKCAAGSETPDLSHVFVGDLRARVTFTLSAFRITYPTSLTTIRSTMEKKLEIEHRVDEVALIVKVGRWRGCTKVGEHAMRPEQALLLYAKDDDEPLPWGRALEELLTELLQRFEQGPE
jgi:hypothetical protein